MTIHYKLINKENVDFKSRDFSDRISITKAIMLLRDEILVSKAKSTRFEITDVEL